MSVMFLITRYYGPHALWSPLQESVLQLCDGLRPAWRPVDKRDDSGVPPAIEYFLDSDTERAELSALRFTIYNEKCSCRVNDRLQGSAVLSANDYYKVRVRDEKINRFAEKCTASPGQECFIAAHT